MCKEAVMGKFNKVAIQFSTKFLSKLLLDSNSGVELQNDHKHLTLHPFHLNEFNKSIKDILNEDVAKYNKDLGGILLGYRNIKLLTNLGAVNHDSCFIHLDLEADFFVFKPVIGKEILAIVNKKSKDHVGCLAHKTFNVSILKPDDQKSHWIGDSVQIGNEVIIRIIFTNLEAKLPYIRGEIIRNLSSEDSGVSTSDETKIVKKIKFDSTSDFETEAKPVKTKKHKKKGHETDSFVNDDERHVKKNCKKDKKALKMELDEDDEVELKTEVFENLDKSTSKKIKKHKKNKKHKHQDLYDDLDEEPVKAEVNDETKKSKRKHAKKLENEEISLPDFDIKELFEDNQASTSNQQHLTTNIDDVLLPHDEELESILNQKSSNSLLDEFETTTKKKKSKKRKASGDFTEESPKKKKHKKSKELIEEEIV